MDDSLSSGKLNLKGTSATNTNIVTRNVDMISLSPIYMFRFHYALKCQLDLIL